MYLDNKYTHWYNDIINAAKTRSKPNSYTEKHHIIPESLGGSNDKENLVYLTSKEHYTVHHLLTKMLIGSPKHKMIHAFHRMSNSNDIKITNKQYEISKKLKSDLMIQLHKDKNSYINSDEYRKKQIDGKNKPEVKKKQSNKMKENHKKENSIYKNLNYIKKHKDSCNTVVFKQKMSDTRKLYWSDPKSKYNDRPDNKRIPPLNNKICNVIDLNGNIVVTDNLKQYCIDNNLNYQSMMTVARGKQKKHKGYECKWI